LFVNVLTGYKEWVLAFTSSFDERPKWSCVFAPRSHL